MSPFGSTPDIRKKAAVATIATALRRLVGGTRRCPQWVIAEGLKRAHHVRFTPKADDREPFLPTRDVSVSAVPRRLQRSPPQDRKSTRLNSSHLGISYAVFCLKKKK